MLPTISGFIRRALAKAGYPSIFRCISINLERIWRKTRDSRYTPELAVQGTLCTGLRRYRSCRCCITRVRMRLVPGERRQSLHAKRLNGRCQGTSHARSIRKPRAAIKQLCQQHHQMNLTAMPGTLMMKKPRVGVVGEILVKFSPSANNHLVELSGARGRRGRSAGSDGFPAVLL